MSASEFFNASPFELMRRFGDEMSRLWSGARDVGVERTWLPAIEVLERDGTMVIRVELPGVKEEDVHVELTDEGIVIHGERRLEEEERGDGFYRSERSYGQFYRLIPLPESADAERAAAEFKGGMLEVSVPIHRQASRQRQIPIKGAAKDTEGKARGESEPANPAGMRGGPAAPSERPSKSRE